MIFKSLIIERTTRLFSFSDWEIYDKNKSIKIHEGILNSWKTRYLMNSASVRVCHATEKDPQILMK